MEVVLTINGERRNIQIEPDEYLAATLRKQGFLSVKQGCETGNCGACTLHVDGKAVLACVMLTAKADGSKITTLEGAGAEATRIGKLLVGEGADQCGYCSSGLIMSILYLESQISNPTEDEMKVYLNGNLCRCTGYEGQMRAVKRYFEVKHHETC